MKKHVDAFMSSVMAGVCISIGCVVNLRVGGVAGAVLFAFGLLSVVHWRLRLYTGTAGFVSTLKEHFGLATILAGNIIGCLAVAGYYRMTGDVIADKCAAIAEARIAAGPLRLVALGAGCGFIMTTAVKFARNGKFLPLLFGVPVFILCGFAHSIADAFYLSCGGMPDMTLAVDYMCVVVGNYIGCNAHRTFDRG